MNQGTIFGYLIVIVIVSSNLGRPNLLKLELQPSLRLTQLCKVLVLLDLFRAIISFELICVHFSLGVWIDW